MAPGDGTKPNNQLLDKTTSQQFPGEAPGLLKNEVISGFKQTFK
jgi:hypothetical protein